MAVSQGILRPATCSEYQRPSATIRNHRTDFPGSLRGRNTACFAVVAHRYGKVSGKVRATGL